MWELPLPDGQLGRARGPAKCGLRQPETVVLLKRQVALLLSPLMRRLWLCSGALALIVFALAGCGGGGGEESTTTSAPPATTPAPLSKEALIAQGDGICAEVNAAVGTVGSTSSGASGQAGQAASLYSGMVERLKALGAPSEASAEYDEFISAAEELAQAESNVKLASEREEEGEALSEAEVEASSALSSFQSAASAYGFEKCAEAPAAPVPGAGAGAGSEEAPSEEAGGVEEEAAPEEVEVAPEEEGGAGAVEEESAGGGAGAGGGTEGGGGGTAGGESGGIGPG